MDRIVEIGSAIECYDNFWLHDEIKFSTLHRLRRGLPLYGLVKEKLKSPEHRLPSLVDLDFELAKLEKVQFAKEWQFHRSVAEVFEKARDSNLFYDAGCFSGFTFLAPFPLVVQTEGGRKTVRVAGEINYSEEIVQAWSKSGVDVLGYAGREVLEIDEVPALEYLTSFAQADGGYFFNSALSRQVFYNKTWQFEAGNFVERKYPPLKHTIEFLFTGLEVVKAPFLALITDGFVDSYSFYKHLCSPASFALEFPIVEALPSALQSPLPSSTKKKHASSIGVFQSNLNAALVIGGFDDSDKWRTELVEALQYLSHQKIEKLVLDLRSSTGEYICASYALLDYFFPDLPSIRFPIIFPPSPIMKAIQGKVSMNYNCTSFIPKSIKPSFKLNIFSDGICTRACSVLVHGLSELYAIPTYILGELKYKVSDFAGAIPYQLNKIHLPKTEPQLTNANLFFPLGQMVTSHTKQLLPLDYVWRLARHHLDYPPSATYIYNQILNTNLTFSLVEK